MTIKSEISRARYVGNGVTTNFAINFPYLTNNDGTAQVAVYVGNSDTPLVEGKDYTVSGIGAYSDYSGETDEGLIVYETRYEGGEVIFVNAPADQEPVAIVRDVPQTQGVVFTEGEDFPAQDFENSLDKLTMEVQQIKENLQRAIVLPPTSDEKPLEARDAILAARSEAVVSAKNALVSETNAKESENITVAAKDLIVNDAGVQVIGADLLGENKIGYVAENLDKVAGNIDTAVQAATAATEAAQIASDAAANAKATIEAETETAKENIGDFTDEKITQINETTNNAVSYVNENIEKSRIWAEGEQAEVEPLGGELSSMGAADLAYALANAPEDVPIDASGLFAMNVVKGEKGDKGDKGEDGKDGKSVFDGYAINCITEIPQDIKLELVDGALTLKAGSKFYIPNGFDADGVTPRFEKKIVGSDVSLLNGAGNEQVMFFTSGNGNSLFRYTKSAIYSGSSKPSVSTKYAAWYDTSVNKIKLTSDTGATWVAQTWSLPLAWGSTTVSSIVSVDQVFNGFGYIGSTVFALPGVKGLIPDGRNADGSLRNVEWVNNKVITGDSTVWGTRTGGAIVTTNAFSVGLDGIYFQNSERFNNQDELRFNYNEVDNQWYYSDNSGASWRPVQLLIFSDDVSLTSGNVTSFTPKQPFHAVDRNDSSWIAQQGKPSNKFVNLTVGASGSTYTAPANGCFVVDSWVTGYYIFLQNRGASAMRNIGQKGSAAGTDISVMVSAKKGDVVELSYDGTWSPHTWQSKPFVFIYDEGEN